MQSFHIMHGVSGAHTDHDQLRRMNGLLIIHLYYWGLISYTPILQFEYTVN